MIYRPTDHYTKQQLGKPTDRYLLEATDNMTILNKHLANEKFFYFGLIFYVQANSCVLGYPKYFRWPKTTC